MLKIKRVYEPVEKADGYRILVDRLWPRGVSKEKAHVDLWFKEIGPSDNLRKWFAHDPSKWSEFKKKYFAELSEKQNLVESLKNKMREGDVTLIYAAKDERFNNSLALQDYLSSGKP